MYIQTKILCTRTSKVNFVAYAPIASDSFCKASTRALAKCIQPLPIVLCTKTVKTFALHPYFCKLQSQYGICHTLFASNTLYKNSERSFAMYP